jgi:hypothetical protein
MPSSISKEMGEPSGPLISSKDVPQGWPSNDPPIEMGLEDEDNMLLATEISDDVVDDDDSSSLDEIILRAARLFLSQHFQEGAPIAKAWFYDALGVKLPTANMPHAAGERLEFEFMRRHSRFVEHMLVEHRIALRNIRGHGYAIVSPRTQAEWARKSLDRDLVKGFRQASMRATFIRTDGLTDAERREAMDTSSNVAKLRQHMSEEKRKLNRRASVMTPGK